MKRYRHGGAHDTEPVKSSMATRFLRGLIPLPLPAAQAAASKITGDTSFGFADVPQDIRDEVALSVINARQRTGSNRGGTEYIDYGEEIYNDIQSLTPNLLDAAVASAKSPDFRAATTFGRVSYSYDPTTDTYSIYDSYDFSPIKGDPSTAYGKTRKALGDGKEGEAKLIGTFKGSDYEGVKGSNDYSHVKRFMSELGELMSSPQYMGPTFKEGGMVKKYRKGGKAKEGFEGYKKIASSKSSNALMAKKAVHHGNHTNAEYKFTKDKEGNMHMYAKFDKGGKAKSKVNEAGNYTKPGMRKRLFNRIKAGNKGGKPGQWSARKAQMLAKAYKAAGGGYKN